MTFDTQSVSNLLIIDLSQHKQKETLKKLIIETIFFPGINYSNDELRKLTTELREVASECFDEVPIYQALTGLREEL